MASSFSLLDNVNHFFLIQVFPLFKARSVWLNKPFFQSHKLNTFSSNDVKQPYFGLFDFTPSGRVCRVFNAKTTVLHVIDLFVATSPENSVHFLCAVIDT